MKKQNQIFFLNDDFFPLKSNFLSEKEILSFFDERSNNKKFVKDYVQDILRTTDRNENGLIRKDEFLVLYWQKILDMKLNLEKNQEKINKYICEREKLLDEFKIVEEMEKTNSFGFNPESHLNLSIKKILSLNYSKINLKNRGKCFPYCIIKSGKNLFYSEIFDGVQNLKPSQSFKIPLETGREIITIVFREKEALNGCDFIGEAKLCISEMKKRNIENKLIELWNEKGFLGFGEILIDLKLIDSKARFLKQLIQNWNETITIEKYQIQIIQRNLEELLEPFPSFDKN